MACLGGTGCAAKIAAPLIRATGDYLSSSGFKKEHRSIFLTLIGLGSEGVLLDEADSGNLDLLDRAGGAPRMSLNAEKLRDLMALGLEGEKLLAVVTIFERDEQRDARSNAAARAKRYREKKKASQQHDVMTHQRDERHCESHDEEKAPSPSSSPLTLPLITTPPTSSLRSEKPAHASERRENGAFQVSAWPPDYREQFWCCYPRKKSKKSAMKVLNRVKSGGEVTFERIMAAVKKIPIHDPQFIPYPASWLNAGGWDDEHLPGENTNGQGRSRTLQDDSRSVSRAIDRQMQSGIQFGARPSLLPDGGQSNLRRLSKG